MLGRRSRFREPLFFCHAAIRTYVRGTVSVNEYREVQTLRDSEAGLVLVITERVGSKQLTFRLQKEYRLNDQLRYTSYLGRRHIPAAIALLKKAEDEIDLAADRRQVGG